MNHILNLVFLEKKILPGWKLTQQNYLPEEETDWETRFTLCNGYLGLRGGLNLSGSGSEAAAYLTGVFDKPYEDEGQTTYGVQGVKSYAPCWHRVEIEVDGQQIDFRNCQLVEFSRTLDMFRGLLFSHYAFEDAAGRISELRTLSFISRHDKHYAYMQVQFTARNYSAPVTVCLLNELQTTPDYLPELRDYIACTQIIGMGEEKGVAYLNCRVEDTGADIMLASATQGDYPIVYQQRPAAIAECCHFQAVVGEKVALQKHVLLSSSLDKQPIDARVKAREIKYHGVAAKYIDHCTAMADEWAAADVSFTGDDETQQGMRWDIFNLIQLGNLGKSNPDCSGD